MRAESVRQVIAAEDRRIQFRRGTVANERGKRGGREGGGNARMVGRRGRGVKRFRRFPRDRVSIWILSIGPSGRATVGASFYPPVDDEVCPATG